MKKHILLQKHSLILILLILSTICASASPSDQDPNKPEDMFDMSLEELMEVPIIVSAARQDQKISELSTPVSLITAEDLHYSGLTTITEILQFTPGVDVRRNDRSRYVVGVRGLHSRISDRTLVLINGRFANDSLFGAPDWLNLPVLIEDIERIEILRGPGGSAWGANASTGVINIVTKKPEDVQGYFGTTTINDFGDTYTHIRWGEKQGKWSWRLSAGYEDFEDSDSAGAGKYESGIPALDPLIGFDNYSARDFMRNWRFDTEASYQYSEWTKWSLGIGHSNFESGSNEFMGYNPQSDDKSSLTRTFARIDHILDDESTAYLQWYGNYLVRYFPNVIHRYTTDENHLEGQLNFNPTDEHSISVGGNLSWLRATTTSSGNPNETVFSDDPYSEQWGGLFLIDHFNITQRLALEGQIRGDFHSENEDDWSTRASAIYALDDAKDHNLRFSYARAFRIPTVAMRNSTKTSVSGLFNILPLEENLQNEDIWSLEAGYTGNITKELTFYANTYYQRIEHMVGVKNVTVGPVTNSTFTNVDGAKAYGAECELALHNKKGKLSTWYAYNVLETDQYGEGMRALWPAKNKAGVTGRLFLPNDWTFNTNYVYNDAVLGYGTTPFDVHSFNRLDLTVAKKIADGRGELMIGMSDILNKTNKVVLDIGELTGHETPGRIFFARLLLKF
jgi:iron complex outermembrane receptor protein